MLSNLICWLFFFFIRSLPKRHLVDPWHTLLFLCVLSVSSDSPYPLFSCRKCTASSPNWQQAFCLPAAYPCTSMLVLQSFFQAFCLGLWLLLLRACPKYKRKSYRTVGSMYRVCHNSQRVVLTPYTCKLTLLLHFRLQTVACEGCPLGYPKSAWGWPLVSY